MQEVREERGKRVWVLYCTLSIDVVRLRCYNQHLRIVINRRFIMACGGCSSENTYTLQLIKKVVLSATVYSYEFKALEPFIWQEGNKAEIFVPINGELVEQTYALATIPEEGTIAFAIKISKEISAYEEQLMSLVEGDIVEVSEPKGNLTLRRDQRPILLLSDDIGILSFRGLVKAFEENQDDIDYLTQINVSSEERPYKEEMDDLSENVNGFKSVYSRDRASIYQLVDFENQALMVKTGQVPYFCIAGDDSFVSELSSYLISVGFNEEDIMMDREASNDDCSGCSGGGCSGCSEK